MKPFAGEHSVMIPLAVFEVSLITFFQRVMVATLAAALDYERRR
jgi:hypothetical protein